MAAACLAIRRRETPCRDWRISSGAVKPRWRIWLSVSILVDSRRALGHHQRPDGFHVAVPGFRRPESSVALGGPGRFDGVDGVGLALAAPGLTVGSVHLDHLDTLAPQDTGPGPPHTMPVPSTPTRAIGPKSPSQTSSFVMASRGGRELGHTQQPADRIQHGRHVQVQVGVHSTRDRARGIYSCHCHPFLSHWSRGGTRRQVRQRCDRPVRAGRSTAPNNKRHTQVRSTNRSKDS